jgi:low temperature requirement protein LtrA
MVERQWWQPPQLILADEHEERRVTWLELFYDLVFVVVISQLTHYLAEHVSRAGALSFVLLFVPIWWVWIGGTFYNARFETQDISYRIATLLQMLPIATMAIFVHDGVGEAAVPFALAYAVSRVLNIILWVRGGLHAPLMRPVTSRYGIGFGCSLLLFVASVFVEPPLRYLMWGVGLLIDLLTPVATLPIQARLPRLSNSKLPERFGLFVIIVLGEGIVSVINGMAEEVFAFPRALDAALGMALIFGLWWLYFDYIARRHPRPGVWWLFAWNYLHLPLVMGIAAVAAGILNVLTLEGGALPPSIRLLLAGALALALGAIGLIELTLWRADDEPTHAAISPALKLGAAGLALAIGLWGGELQHATLLLILLGLELISMI